MALMVRQVENIVPLGAVLGEGPVWDGERGCLWFVDIKGKRLHRYDPATGRIEAHEAGGEIGWALPAENGRILCGLQDGLHWFDPASGTFIFWQAVPGEPATNRLNDATTDPFGCVWFGSMDNGETERTGNFYCLEGETIRPAGPHGICITNGPALCADGRTIYFTDTLERRIMTASVDILGNVGPAQLFVQLTEQDGYPDGPVIDSEGCLWTGLFGGWGLRRFSPEGALLETVTLPVANVTKLAFGGPDLRTAYVTTATKGLSESERAAQPLAGNLFSFRVDVPGIPTAPVRI